MEMRKRFTEKYTSIIGAIILLIAVGLYTVSKFKPEFEVNSIELATVATLGWVFLTARDTLLEGLFLNLFKINKSDGGE